MVVAIGRRLLSAVLVIVGVVIVVFLIQRLVSNPMAPYISSSMTQADIAHLRHTLGFDKPWIVQFGAFLSHVFTGNFGTSRVYGLPVTQVIINAVPVTASLVALSLVFALVIGTVAGIVAAVYKTRWIDSFIMGGSLVGQAIPAFWLAVLLVLVFSVYLGVLPSGGYNSPEDLILPVIALGANSANQFARVVRSEMIEVLSRDYIRTARAQGVSNLRIYLRHAFRNSLLPVVTVLGVQISNMIAGTVVIEQVFSIPGVSRLLFNSIIQGDYAVTQAIAIYAAVVVTLVNLLVDLSYSWLDPRIKFGATS